VVYVVDCGRVKENRKDEVNEMPTLVECWVSRASAKVSAFKRLKRKGCVVHAIWLTQVFFVVAATKRSCRSCSAWNCISYVLQSYL
jgi:hypothetical protein